MVCIFRITFLTFTGCMISMICTWPIEIMLRESATSLCISALWHPHVILISTVWRHWALSRVSDSWATSFTGTSFLTNWVTPTGTWHWSSWVHSTMTHTLDQMGMLLSGSLELGTLSAKKSSATYWASRPLLMLSRRHLWDIFWVRRWRSFGVIYQVAEARIHLHSYLMSYITQPSGIFRWY